MILTAGLDLSIDNDSLLGRNTQGGGLQLSGNVYETFQFGDLLSIDEINQMNTYLMDKWGI